MKKSILILLLIIIPIAFVYSQGFVLNDTMYSAALVEDRLVDVYLPVGYDHQDEETRYPVIYFLHGLGLDQDSYPGLIQILDQGIGTDIEPVIVVKPSSYVEPFQGSFYTNSILNGNFEDYIVDDLVEYIDNTYNTIADRSKRCLMGHSMGGYGAVKLAMYHQDKFSGVASHSGTLATDAVYDDVILSILQENGGSGPFDPEAGFFTLAMYAYSAAFSPNLDNPPYFVDLPIDDEGNMIDSVFSIWLAHDVATIARDHLTNSDLSIYLDCGIQDERFCFGQNNAYSDTLNAIGIDHEYQIYTGGHSDLLLERFPISLTFLDSLFQVETGVDFDNELLPSSYVVTPPYPNPFNASTSISLYLPQRSYVSVRVFNILGEQVGFVADNWFNEGKVVLPFNAGDLSSGSYYFQVFSPGRINSTHATVHLK